MIIALLVWNILLTLYVLGVHFGYLWHINVTHGDDPRKLL